MVRVRLEDLTALGLPYARVDVDGVAIISINSRLTPREQGLACIEAMTDEEITAAMQDRCEHGLAAQPLTAA